MRILRIEKAMMIGLAVVILWTAWSGHVMSNIEENMTRLHVIADSNTQEAQALKLKVRDSVLETAVKLTSGCENSAEANEVLKENLELINNTAQDTVLSNGYTWNVSTVLETEHYPIRDYDTFSLPSGDYSSLKVTIGSGQGENWWCVLFPPLCIAAAEGEYLVKYTGLTDREWDVLRSDEDGYEVRFLLLDLFSRVKYSLRG